MAQAQTPAQGKCPICSRPSERQYRPFCSRRCADVDLSRWLRGAYAIPGEKGGTDGDGVPPAPPGEDAGDDENGK